MAVDIAADVIASTRVLISVFTIFFIGFLLVRFKIMKPEGLETVVQLINWVFYPCSLLTSIGGNISVYIMSYLYVVSLVAVGRTVLFGLIGYFILLPLSGSPKWFRPWFLMTVTLNNDIAIPLLFVSSVCTQAPIKAPSYLNQTAEEPYMTTAQCISTGGVVVFIGVLITSIMTYVLAFDMVRLMGGLEPSDMSITDCDAKKLTPNMLAPESCNSMNTDSSNEISIEALEGGKDTQTLTCDAATGTTPATWVSSAIVEPSPNPIMPVKKPDSFAVRLLKKIWDTLRRPIVIAQLLGLFIGLVEPIQHVLFSSTSVLYSVTSALIALGDALVAGLNLVLSCNLGFKMQRTSMKNLELGVPKRTMVVLLVGKMFLMPACGIAVILALRGAIFPGAGNDFIVFVMCFVCCTPTSNDCILLSQLMGQHKVSEILSLVYLGQYSFSILSMTAYIVGLLAILNNMQT